MTIFEERLDPMLEATLNGAPRRFKSLRFWRSLGITGLAVMGVVLLLGVLMWRGALQSLQATLVLFAVLLVLALLAVPVLGLVALASYRSRAWAANTVEEANSSLLDRLNTLVFLRSDAGRDAAGEAYEQRIERQATRELLWEVKPFAGAGRRTGRIWLLLLLLSVMTLGFYVELRPFRNLTNTSRIQQQAAASQPLMPDAPIVDATELQGEDETAGWGEVRITEPGRDLKVTKVDVVPLLIEAAASQPLDEAWWTTAKSGETPDRRDLPAPAEPRYAVYKPILYVDELRLADWDVVTYHAGAAAGDGEYASEIFFLEVRPFREEIEKLQGGGEGDEGYNLLGQLSGLIDRQKHVLRETHRFLARALRPGVDDELQRQDQEKLAEAEGEIAATARHLYAQIAAQMENLPVAEVLDRLASAELQLDLATTALAEDPHEAPPPEHAGLSELVATRKAFQRSMSESGESSGEKEESIFDDQLPTAERLEQISEFRDEEKAAQELIDQLIEEQRQFAEEIESNPGQCSGLAPGHSASSGALDQFQRDHPQLRQKTKAEADRAAEKLDEANDALAQGDAEAAGESQAEALEALEDLREAVERQAAIRQLGDAYKLKELLDEQAERMGEMESQGGASREEASQAAGESRGTTRELKDLVEESDAMSQLFGPELGEALADARQADRERQLDELENAPAGEARAEAAGEARDELRELSRAFEESAPELARELRKEDPLKPGDREALDSGLRQLRGLAERESQGDDGEAQRREALRNLEQGLDGLYFEGQDRAADLLEEFEEVLGDQEIDVDRLRRLLDEIDHFRREMGDAELERPPVELAHIDPSKLPAEYRERIQTYFRKLSER